MAEPKTRPGDADVNAFLDGVADERRREDARAVCAMMKKITRREPVLWARGAGSTQDGTIVPLYPGSGQGGSDGARQADQKIRRASAQEVADTLISCLS
jgi:hypothetical protein